MSLIVDAQVHLWAFERGTPSRGRLAHRSGLWRTEEMLSAMDAAGVDRAVIVPPPWADDRNAYALAAAQTPLRTQPGRLFGTALLAWALTTSLILIEPYLRAQFCADDQSFCRPSARLEIWSWAIANLAEHPLFGLGPTFRFDSIVLNHPHNSFLGMAMFFGLPALAAFIALAYAYCLRLTQAGGQLNYFCSAALVANAS